MNLPPSTTTPSYTPPPPPPPPTSFPTLHGTITNNSSSIPHYSINPTNDSIASNSFAQNQIPIPSIPIEDDITDYTSFPAHSRRVVPAESQGFSDIQTYTNRREIEGNQEEEEEGNLTKELEDDVVVEDSEAEFEGLPEPGMIYFIYFDATTYSNNFHSIQSRY